MPEIQEINIQEPIQDQNQIDSFSAYDERELCMELLQKFEVDRAARQQYEDEVIRSYKQYVAYVKELTEADREKIGNRSRLFIPKTYQQVDTFRARALKALFNISPYFDFVPKPTKNSSPEMMMENEEKAKIPASLVNSQLDKNNIVAIAFEWLTSMAFGKGAILSVGWRWETRTVRKRVSFMTRLAQNATKFLSGRMSEISWEKIEETEETIWDDNEIQNVDWFDFWPDARGRNSNPDSWRHCWYRDWMTRNQIEQHLKKMQEAGADVFEISDREWEQLVSNNSGLEEGRQQRLNAVAKEIDVQDSADVNKSSRLKDEKNILYEVLRYYTGEEYGLIISRYKLACFGPTPYWRHKKIPFIFQPYDPLPNEVQGRSFCDWLYHLQEELNTNRNQRIDNRSLAMNVQWTTTDEDMPEKIYSVPGKVHRMSQAGALEPLAVADMTGSSVQEEQIIHQDMENAMGTPAVAMGVDSQRDQTATEITTKNSNASARFDVRINLWQSSLKRLCYLMDMNNQQFVTDNRLIQIADEEGIKKWREIGIDDINGEWDYIPAGVNVDPYANKELRRQQLMSMLELADKAKLNWDKDVIGEDMLKTFDVRNPQKYKLSPEKMAQQQKDAAQQQQALVQQQQQQIQQEAQFDMQKELMKILGDVIKESVKQNPMMLQQLIGGLSQGMGMPESGQAVQPAMDINQL